MACDAMHILSIDHIHFNFAPQYREQIRFFYVTVLGARELPVPENRHVLQFLLGSQRLYFTPQALRQSPSAAQHVAFNVQGMGDLKNRLLAFDLVFIENHPAMAAQQVYIKDPAGNQLEFLELAA